MKRTLLFLCALILGVAMQAQLENTTWGLSTSGTQFSVVNFDGAGLLNLEVSPGVFAPVSNYTISGNQITITESQGASWFGCTGPGVYTFVIQGNELIFTLVSDDCELRSQFMTMFTWTSISTNVNAHTTTDLSIYPNPSNGDIHVEHDAPGTSMIRVIDMGGRIVYTTRSTGERTHIDLGSLTRGVYLVEVLTPDEKVMQRVVLN